MKQSKRDEFYGKLMAAAGFLGHAAQTATDSDFCGCGVHVNLAHAIVRAEEMIEEARALLGVPLPKPPIHVLTVAKLPIPSMN